MPIDRNRGLSVRECWERLQRVDEEIAELPIYASPKFDLLLQRRQWFEKQLERLLNKWRNENAKQRTQ
jgi:hypothetical protein